VNLVITPSVGRIMRFGYPDEDNVLWTNPNHRPPRLGEDLESKPDESAPPIESADPIKAPPPPLKWKNYGGDKLWPWPQDQWPQYIGRAWPPPGEVDHLHQRAWFVHGAGPMAAEMESEPIAGYGVRARRLITLDPREPRVTLVSRFERASGELPPLELAAWQITQVPFGGTVYAKMALGGKVTGLAPAPWDAHHEAGAGVIVLELPKTAQSKTGLDADALAVASGEILFVARSQTATLESSKFRPGERAQVFVQSAPDAKEPPKNTPTRYIELEFTSPRKDLARDQIPELHVTWELHRKESGVGKGKWSDEEVVEVLSGNVRKKTPDPKKKSKDEDRKEKEEDY
jgi:hypothetical protein